uniref:Protein DSF2 n=1 Tax=Talaromyces marneffei PM1 TaxID=1077442 RepID=A0A093W1Z7_TALMA
MPLKGILHRHGKADADKNNVHPPTTPQEFTFIRTDTYTQETITPAAINTSITNIAAAGPTEEAQSPTTPTTSRRKSFFRRRSHISSTENLASPPRSGSEKSISNLLHLDHHSRSSLSRSGSTSSVNIPADLPQIDPNAVADEQDREAQWEKRATRLVQGNPRIGGGSGVSPDRISRSASSTGAGSGAGAANFSYLQPNQGQQRPRSRSNSGVSEPQADVNIQEAILLHENGELEKSTQLFGILADPNGSNNAIAQVLYGLALRHGWGCTPDLPKAVIYLSAAATNSANIETLALEAGLKKGGAAKGELVLAIYELANCFRNGWGIDKDPIAARLYYETAANLGDTDAMNELYGGEVLSSR